MIHIMAEECSTEQSSAATSSSPQPHWWDGSSSWNQPNPIWSQPNPNSTSCDDNVSIHDRFMPQPPASDHHIWSQVFLGAGSNGEMQNSEVVGENAKRVSTGMFDPACDYLKQLEQWEFTNSPSFNGFTDALLNDSKKLSKLVSNWSIAPPNPDLDRHFDPHPCTMCLHGTTNCLHMCPSYHQTDHLKLEDDHWEMEGASSPAGDLLRRRSPFHVNGIAINNSIAGDGNYENQICPRNFADVISFSSRLGKALIDNAPKPSLKIPNSSDNCKKALQNNYPTRINGGRGQGMNEGKKKRISEDNSESNPKKTKQESSTVSSTAKVPKVKLADKITTLQQIVSPFGKTDTASVLYEAIGYIKFLQEQVQLLSNPYMKTNSPKDPWGGMMDRKEKGDARHDLRSKGLCLVPISCTPQVYRENTGSDYWTPAYRGCLYR